MTANTSEDPYGQILEKALAYVSIRPRSIKELMQYIQKKAYAVQKKPDEALNQALITRLKELGYADDVAFSTWWINARSKTSIKGVRILRSELMQKGVKRSIIDAVLSEQTDTETETEKACKIIRKKMHAWGALSGKELQNKMYAFLARRGFASDVIRMSVEKTLETSYNMERI